MAPLATVEDVRTQLQRELTAAETARTPDILAKASAAFRRISRQQFTPGESAVRLLVQGGEIHLEQKPVIAVTAVVNDHGDDVDHQLDGQLLRVTRNGCPLASHQFVKVTYSHGGTIPDEVRIAVAEIAAKVLRIPAAAAAGISMQQRSADVYSENNTYAAWAVGGATSLSPDDRALAESYRSRRTKVIVQHP